MVPGASMPARWPAFPLAASLLAAPALAAAPARKSDPPKPSGPPVFSVDHAITLRTIQGITWSRDSRRVAFVVNAPDTAENTTNQDIWLWDAASNTCRALTRHPKNDYAPQFSPGGDTLEIGR